MPVTSTESKFNCSACGKEYRWKPELAGKKAKCKCGGVIAVPATAPSTAAAKPAAAKPAGARSAPRPAKQEVDFDGLYALAQEEKKATARPAAQASDQAASGYRCPSCSTNIPPGTAVCPNCRLDMRTGMRIGLPGGGAGVLAAAGAYASATPTARAAVLPYGGGGRGAAATARGGADEEILYEGGKFRSLYLPLGLIVLGILFYFGQVAFSNDKLSAGVMVGLVAVRIVLDSILIFIAMLIAVRAFDMGFGAFGPAILKVLAIALGPGALGQMVEAMMGGEVMAIMVGVFVSVVLYFSLIKVLFNLDLGETFLLVVLIIGVRRVLGTFLFVAIIGMASSGLLSEEGAGAIGVGAAAIATAGADDEDVPPKRTMDPEEIAEDLDKASQRRLAAIDGGYHPRQRMDSNPLNTLAGMNREESEQFLQTLEQAGAVDIRQMDETARMTKDGAPYGTTNAIMIELPTDPAARKRIFDIRAGIEQKLGLQPVIIQVEAGGPVEEWDKLKREPLRDWGQKYLLIRLLKDSYDLDDESVEPEDEDGEGDGEAMDEAGAPAARPAPLQAAPADGTAPPGATPPAEGAAPPGTTETPAPAPANAPF